MIRFEVAVADLSAAPAVPGTTVITPWFQLLEPDQLLEAGFFIGDKVAAAMGRVFHHGDFWITDDPEFVQETAVMASHVDCEDCQVGRDETVATMRNHPGMQFMLGHLYFVDASSN